MANINMKINGNIQIKVDDDANRDKKFADLSSIVFINL